jgi:hypothetical protein
VKVDDPEEPSEGEKQEEKPLVVTEEPKEEEVEPPPLISTEDNRDLLVSCLYMYVMFLFLLIWKVLFIYLIFCRV